jgi:hypothetical protein
MMALLENMQNLMQLFHQVLQDFYQQEFILNVKIPERAMIGHPI